jgi:predicted RNA-binding protein with PIN domain
LSKREEYLLIDGYNLIFSWPKLNKMALTSLEDARHKLLEILCDYQGYKQCVITAVFDAHLTNKSIGTIEKYKNIFVVFTQTAETADNFIERTTATLAKRDIVRVVTSDYLEQIIILGSGARRLSANELYIDVLEVEKGIRNKIDEIKPIKNNQLLDNMDSDMVKKLDELIRG